MPRAMAGRSASCANCCAMSSARHRRRRTPQPCCATGSAPGSSAALPERAGALAARGGALRGWGATPLAYNRDPPSQGSRMSNPAYGSVLQMIGNTPLMAVRRLDTAPCQLFLKLENQNPGGSIKDSVGQHLLPPAARSGTLNPRGTLIEATSSNTS